MGRCREVGNCVLLAVFAEFDGGIVGNFVVAGSPFLVGIFIARGVCLQKNNKK